jgi:hypothetical protein
MRNGSITSFDFCNKINEDENEDAIGISENSNFHLFAMSDGAGGAGIYCKEWANFIVNNQPEFPILSDEEANNWFQNISQSFYEFIKPKVNYDNIFIGERFDNEGSYATLLYVWLSKTDKKYFLTGIGDTTLFFFKKKNEDYSVSLIYPINKQSSLNDNPDLINWQRPLEYSLLSKSVDYEPGDTIIICTDSLSRRITYQLLLINQSETEQCLNENINKTYRRDFLEHLKINQRIFNVNEFIKYLRNLIGLDKNSFRVELTKWIERNELEKDDYSFIIIDL